MSEYRVGFTPESQRLLEEAWARAPQKVERELRAFMERATLRLEAESKDRTPTDRGTLRGSIFSEVKTFSDGLGVEGIVGTSLNYALPVELGARPHWVPLEPLVDWVKRKGLAALTPFVRGTPLAKRKKLAVRREAAVMRVARAIRFSIARRGTSAFQRARHGKSGAEMFLETYEAERAALVQEFEAMAQRLVDELSQ